MRLWILRPIGCPSSSGPWDPWYDKSFGFVVRAEDEASARSMVYEEAGDEIRDNAGKSPWLDDKLTTCVELTADGSEEVIIRDFAAA